MGHACSARVPANPAAAEQLDDRAAVAVPDFPRQGIRIVGPEYPNAGNLANKEEGTRV